MDIRMLRFNHGPDSTIGVMFTGGEFECYTCEDGHRDVKVLRRTRIPEGRYEIKLRAAGGMHNKYSSKFSFHQGMLHLQDVPGFEWVYVHIGNNDEDTEGCILTGMSTTTYKVGGGSVGYSVRAYKILYLKVLQELERGEKVFIECASI